VPVMPHGTVNHATKDKTVESDATIDDVGRTSMSEPRITVVITSYNQKVFLSQAIDSVISQTLRPHEILIADDHSTDGSIELIEDYAARHPGWIKAIIQPRNVGVAKNRNEALSRVKGDMVTFLDGDDRFLPRKLEREFATYRATPNVQIVHSNMFGIDRSGRRLRVWADGEVPPEGYVFARVLARRYPGGTTFRNELAETRCLREVGGYDENLPRYGDWDLIIRLTRRFRTAYCPEPLTEYRRHEDSLSHAPGPVHLAAVLMIYEKDRPLLGDLWDRDRADIERCFQKQFALLSQLAAMEAMDSHNRKMAFEYWAKSLGHDRKSRPVLLARIFLPRWAYRGLASAYHGTK